MKKYWQILEKVLNTGKVSIIASFNFKRLKNGKLTYEILLSLRARNTNRDIIDLLSFKTKCSQLTENGCSYDKKNRPSGGATLIPSEDGLCYSEINRIEELKKWLPYQKILEKLVKKYSKMNVTEKLKHDIEVLIYNVLTENYQDSAKEELRDIGRMIPLLRECFPNEVKSAMVTYELEQIIKNGVNILEDYLVFAQLLGIADKVEEQFSKLYPDFKEISNNESSGCIEKNLFFMTKFTWNFGVFARAYGMTTCS